MDRVLARLPFILVYLNNVLVASPDHTTHRQHLREVERPHHQPAEVCLRPGGGEVLGTTGFLASGICPLPGHVEAVVQFPRPSTPLDLQRFLGLVNFYCWFLGGAAGFLLPLTNALQGPGKSLAWSPLPH